MEEKILVEDSQKILTPVIDKGNLYSIILIVVSICTLYITIMTHQIWIAFFIVIPLLYISRKEEEKRGGKNLKQRIFEELSKIANFLFMLTLIVIVIALFFKIGFLFTAILVGISFKSYNYISGVIIRRNFEKHNSVKSEVF